MLAQRMLAAVLSIVACVGVAGAQSRKPTVQQQYTTDDKRGTKDSPLIVEMTNPPSEDKRGTKGSPLIVEMTNPPNGDSIVAELKKERDGRANDYWSIFLGVVQAGILFYTASVARKGASVAANANQIAQINLEREEKLVQLQAHARMRPGFKFLEESAQIEQPKDFSLKCQNLGFGTGTLKSVAIKAADSAPSVPPTEAEGYKVWQTSQLFEYKEARSFVVRDLISEDNQFLCGFIRWEDPLGQWLYSFCVRVSSSPPEGYDEFDEWQVDGWNIESNESPAQTGSSFGLRRPIKLRRPTPFV
jgi:hypothetical protein